MLASSAPGRSALLPAALCKHKGSLSKRQIINGRIYVRGAIQALSRRKKPKSVVTAQADRRQQQSCKLLLLHCAIPVNYLNKSVLKMIPLSISQYTWYHELPQVSLPLRFHRHVKGVLSQTPALRSFAQCYTSVHARYEYTFQGDTISGLGQLWAHLMPLKQHSCVLAQHPSHSTICSYCPIQ